MTDDGIIKIVKETPIRGTVEKTYAFAADFSTSIQSALENISGDAFMGLIMQYISSFVKSFQEYCKRDNINIKEDISTFTLTSAVIKA
ncbi:MAG: hypothetical protein LBV41_08275, partial [Cytophagaceae bacterium]|jgi:hypothetical protein|nr:hypothetical protein [Cytophagaceae bacterium]